MAMQIENLNDLFIQEIRQLYSAEDQMINALPDMEGNAADKELKTSFGNQLEACREQKDRLDNIAGQLGFDANADHSKGMQCLIEEAHYRMDRAADNSVKDATMVLAAQRCHHYTVAGYGSALQYAKQLGYKEATEQLAQTLREKKDADKALTHIAKADINAEAQPA